MSRRDWVAWHRPYEDPASPLSSRLALVQTHLARTLDRCPPGPVRLISFCAGQGHDVIGVLSRHQRANDVRARLVELDPRNAALARAAAAAATLDGVEVVVGDAGVTDAYAHAVPADVIMVCGVFGNVTDPDIARTVAHLPALSAPEATVIWTRHRRPPDLTGDIRRWLDQAGFAEEAFEAPPNTWVSVGVHRLTGRPSGFTPGVRLFRFTDDRDDRDDRDGSERSGMAGPP